MTFLAPEFFADKINIVAIILGGITLVMFSEFVNKKIVFPIADLVRIQTRKELLKTTPSENLKTAYGYLSDALATVVFLSYIYFGSYILAEFLYAPLLFRLKHITVITFAGLFIGITYIINTKKIRSKFFHI